MSTRPNKPTLDDLRIERRDRPQSRFGFWPVAALALVVLIAAGAFWWFQRPRPVEVRTAPVREAAGPGAQHTVLNASGYVTARRAATVSAKTTGRVIEVLVEEGVRVKEGQVLARLDDTNTRASLKLAEAQLESARRALAETQVRLKEANQELTRVADLVQNKISTPADHDHAEAAALAYQARLAQQQADIVVAERTLATWEQQLDDTVIRAPFSGVVTIKNAQPGEMVSPISAGGGYTRTGICTLVDMESLEIEIDVNESYINRVEPGQPVEATLDAYQDWKIPGKVIAIIPTADRQKSTVKVRVGFEKLDPRILPEMGVKVAFREGGNGPAAPVATRVVLAPKGCVQQRNGRDVVLVVQNGRAERRAVTVSGAGVDTVLISAGVSAGERVVVDAPPGLEDGAAVVEKR